METIQVEQYYSTNKSYLQKTDNSNYAKKVNNLNNIK